MRLILLVSFLLINTSFLAAQAEPKDLLVVAGSKLEHLGWYSKVGTMKVSTAELKERLAATDLKATTSLILSSKPAAKGELNTLWYTDWATSSPKMIRIDAEEYDILLSYAQGKLIENAKANTVWTMQTTTMTAMRTVTKYVNETREILVPVTKDGMVVYEKRTITEAKAIFVEEPYTYTAYQPATVIPDNDQALKLVNELNHVTNSTSRKIQKTSLAIYLLQNYKQYDQLPLDLRNVIDEYKSLIETQAKSMLGKLSDKTAPSIGEPVIFASSEQNASSSLLKGTLNPIYNVVTEKGHQYAFVWSGSNLFVTRVTAKQPAGTAFLTVLNEEWIKELRATPSRPVLKSFDTLKPEPDSKPLPK